MFNLADIVVILVIGIAVFSGYKKGFIKTSFGILSFILAIVLTFMFYKPVMVYLKDNTQIEEWITEYLYNIDFGDNFNNTNDDTDEPDSENKGESFLSNLPQVVIEMLELDKYKDDLKADIIQKIVDFAMKLLAIIIVYISAKLLLTIVVLVLNSIFKLPVLKQFNELLGLIVGFVLGLIHVYVILAIVALVSSMPVAEGLTNLVNNSLFARILYNNNLLIQILF